MKNLEELEFANNRLKSLPNEICDCSGLEELYLDDNSLKSLPDAIGNLSSLTELYLQSNKLEELPDGTRNLADTLKEINLRENKIPKSEEEKPKQILKYAQFR